MRSGAGARPREPDARGGMATGQSQPLLPQLSDRAPGACPRAALVGPAYLHAPPAGAALSHGWRCATPARARAAKLRFWAALGTALWRRV